jgi:hypothetical protein
MLAIFCKHCKNIIYSRSRHDYRSCDCGKCSIDGGFSYSRFIGNEEDYIILEIDEKEMLIYIMYYDYQYGNKNAKNFPDGYYGKFIIREGSNPYFYKKTENYILEVIADEIK